MSALTKTKFAHTVMRMNVHRPAIGKKAVNLTVDAELLADSKAAGINLSKALEEQLRKMRVDAWKQGNAEAIRQLNEDIEKNGIWSEGARAW